MAISDHIILAATEEGLGTCWVCALTSPKAKEILACPDGVRIVGHDPDGLSCSRSPFPSVRQPLRRLVRKNRWIGGQRSAWTPARWAR